MSAFRRPVEAILLEQNERRQSGPAKKLAMAERVKRVDALRHEPLAVIMARTGHTESQVRTALNKARRERLMGGAR